MTLEQVEALVEDLNEETEARRAFELEWEKEAQAEMDAAQAAEDWQNTFGSEFLLQDELSGFRRRT